MNTPPSDILAIAVERMIDAVVEREAATTAYLNHTQNRVAETLRRRPDALELREFAGRDTDRILHGEPEEKYT